MSFPRYPAYKDSGVEWLGEVPEHWAVLPLKRRIARIESGTSVNAIDVPASDGEYGVLKTSCVYTGEFDPNENKAVVPEEYGRATCPLRSGALIVSRMNTPDLVGAAGLVHEGSERIFLPDRLWQIQFSGLEPRFVHRWTQSGLYRAQVQVACAGTSASMQNLAQDQFGAFLLAAPPAHEQTAIAAFLDRETAKIDALVAEQEKLISLLQEKRQAVISHAVTKGLDPNVPMKDSGVEWLGEVPAHWSVATCGRYASVLAGYAFPSDGFTDDESATRLLRGVNVGVGEVRWNETVYWGRTEDDGLDRFELSAGDIVLGMDRPLVSGGIRVARLRAVDVPCLLLQRVALIRTHANLDPGFMYKVLRCQAFADYFTPDLTGVSVPHISPDQILGFHIPVPPRNEQTAIAAFLDRETAKIDALIVDAARSIDLLKERRAALISAAVTGQIDVRGLATEPA